MEPRGCIGEYDRDQDRYTIRCTIQSVHATRAALADRIFKLPQHQFRVVCDNMGGGFGMKGGCLSGIRAVLVGLGGSSAGRCGGFPSAAKGSPSDEQGRGSVVDAELALDRDGPFLALRAWQQRSAPIIRPTARPYR